jgi:DNA (cytosine-5)-methyltransferase 1
VRAYTPFLSDPRNFLFRAFLDVVEQLRPKVVLIENVRQILTHAGGAIAAEIVERLDVLGYRAQAKILNAAEFGVPQLRQRAFFVAVRKDLVPDRTPLPWPEPTHASDVQMDLVTDLFKPSSGLTSLPGDRGLFVTVEEALSDLPPAKAERDGNPRFPVKAYPNVPISTFRRFVRSKTATPANHVYRTPSEQVIRRLRAMKPGMKTHELPAELQTKKYYYNAYGRLEWERPANTITKSFLYPGSGKFGHPDEHRVISYREAARLQSFDDDFVFYATSQEGLAHMIGSAVPPLLGYRFGQSFAELLDSLGDSRNAELFRAGSRGLVDSANEGILDLQ